MTFLGTLLAELAYLTPPVPSGWFVWLALLALILYNLYRWRQVQPAWKGSSWGLLFVLTLLTPLTSLFVGLRLPSDTALPLPGLPVEPAGMVIMLLSAIPWTLAAGLLGPLGAALLGALAGLVRGFWDTHSLFTTLEFALLGLIFSVNIRQRYRPALYRLIGQPLVSAMILVPLHALLYVIGLLFTVQAELAARLDYALSTAGASALAFGSELLIAGLTAQVLATAFPSAWGRKLALQPSPAERSLETRFLFGTGTFVSLLLLTLLIGDWSVAGSAARSMLRDRLRSNAETAAEIVPFFLETGQNLAVQLASDARLLESSDPELSSILGQRMQAVPYFDHFVVIDAANKSVLGGYPTSARQDFVLSPEENAGVALAVSGVLTQIYAIPPTTRDESAQVSFMVAIVDNSGQVQRILIGRTGLATNPLTQPLINSLSSMGDLDGSGLLLDENGRILVRSENSQFTTDYLGERKDQAAFYDDTAPDGTRQLVYYQPVLGRPWAVVLTIPAQQAQQLAINIATPLSIMIVLLTLTALISLRIGLRVVTGSLQNLASEANRIAQGQLDHPLHVDGVDEVGQLRRAFEQMRLSLRSRLDELNRLLTVSQGVASSLEMEDVVKPVLEAVLASGASAACVVLSPTILPDKTIETPSRFALGLAGEAYAHLDEQILALTKQQERLVLPNPARMRTLGLDPHQPQPASLLAVALRHENRFYGAMWAAYDQPRSFAESDVRFISTLAGQASLAIANAHLFLSVEVGRQQLEAILNSTADPVLVTDHRNRLLLANAAAVQLFGNAVVAGEGKTIQRVIDQKPLIDLLQASSEQQSAEIILPGERTYFATASTVMADGKPVGRVCILRDVTRFKELDMLKSEFVATVSHDLRSPLTLMRGYATMLEMVGELNEQQQGYVRKIISGVENMSRLVNNLLDLGRIEMGVGLQVEKVAVLDILERVTGALQLQANQKDIALNMELSKDIPQMVEADQALLHQAIYNLVENGIKYTPNGGRVSVRVRSVPDHLVFEVEDSGIGIQQADLARLFEKFYRGKQREAYAQQGSGLGLAIVRSIAERHGGKVWVESEVGKGSTFYLQIPLVQPQERRAA